MRQPVPGAFQRTEIFETMLKPLVNAAAAAAIPLLAESESPRRAVIALHRDTQEPQGPLR